MTNVINLEQLDYRDQLIKDYIDTHSQQGGGGGGTGSSDYIVFRMVLTRQNMDVSPSGEDEQHIYLGVPTGTDISNFELMYVRSCTVRKRNKAAGIYGYMNKWRGVHQVWKIPTKDQIPLVTLGFKDKTASDFTKEGYDYYEIGGVWEGEYYNMLDFINQGFGDGYQDVADIMSRRRSGLIVFNGDKIVSGHVRFRSCYSDQLDQWRLGLY